MNCSLECDLSQSVGSCSSAKGDTWAVATPVLGEVCDKSSSTGSLSLHSGHTQSLSWQGSSLWPGGDGFYQPPWLISSRILTFSKALWALCAGSHSKEPRVGVSGVLLYNFPCTPQWQDERGCGAAINTGWGWIALATKRSLSVSLQ